MTELVSGIVAIAIFAIPFFIPVFISWIKTTCKNTHDSILRLDKEITAVSNTTHDEALDAQLPKDFSINDTMFVVDPPFHPPGVYVKYTFTDGNEMFVDVGDMVYTDANVCNDAEALPSARVCPSCGAPVNPNNRICAYCEVPYPI